MEIPQTLRYDVLLVVLGALMIIAPFYYNVLTTQPISAIFIYAGLIFFIFGFDYIRDDYELEMDYKENRYIKENFELINFCRRKDLISETKKNEMIGKLKTTLRKK